MALFVLSLTAACAAGRASLKNTIAACAADHGDDVQAYERCIAGESAETLKPVQPAPQAAPAVPVAPATRPPARSQQSSRDAQAPVTSQSAGEGDEELSLYEVIVIKNREIKDIESRMSLAASDYRSKIGHGSVLDPQVRRDRNAARRRFDALRRQWEDLKIQIIELWTEKILTLSGTERQRLKDLTRRLQNYRIPDDPIEADSFFKRQERQRQQGQ